MTKSWRANWTGIAYHKEDNAFRWIADLRRAQRFADRLVRIRWHCRLNHLAQRVNPLLGDLLGGMNYYWVTDQAEYATDVMFPNPASLKPYYEQWVKHARLYFTAEDMLTFLGRKLPPTSKERFSRIARRSGGLVHG